MTIYTDGGCHGNPGPGGWAWRAVEQDGSVIAADSGYEERTTNNRMELTAVIRALEWAERSAPDQEIRVVTDSQYVRQGITSWINTWRTNGWRTSNKKPVKNSDLWRALDALHGRLSPAWAWVRGHSGDEHNEACDRAVQAAIHKAM